MSDTLRTEAERLQYALRSAFFYQRQSEFSRLSTEVETFDGSNLTWQPLSELSISRQAWEAVQKWGVEPWLVFSHPDTLVANPRLIAYYRLLAGLPQKGVQRLAFPTASYEDGRSKNLPPQRALSLSQSFNRHICALIESDPRASLVALRLAAAMNYGSQVNGSWRNEIGQEGPRRVKQLLIANFQREDLVKAFVLKSGQQAPPSAPLHSVDDIAEVIFTNDYRMRFGSEPDISLLNPNSVTDGAIEVKAGLDPAGALERFGAALKSFRQARSDNKNAITILLASCLTDEVKQRIASEPLVSYHFNLTEVLADRATEAQLMSQVKHILHL